MASRVDDAPGTTGTDLGQRITSQDQPGGKPTEGGKFHPTIPGKLANIDIRNILEQYAEGITIPELATNLGVHKSSLSRAMRSVAGESWGELKEQHYEICLDDGLAAMKAAEDDCNLARAREAYMRRLEWRAEREHPSRWGSRPTMAIQANGDGITVNVVTFSQQPATQQSSDSTE